MSSSNSGSNSSGIARPLSITSIIQASATNNTANRRRVSSISEFEKKKPTTIVYKSPTSRLSKSNSMHRLADSYQSDEKEEKDEESENQFDRYQMHRRALLSGATTTPMLRPSTLIKRFSSTEPTGVLTKSTTAAVKSASSTTNNYNTKLTTDMKRSASLMNNPINSNSSDNSSGNPNFRIGQRVHVPSLDIFGTVRFYGETKFKGNGGKWIGLELDIKGSGKNDGSIQGVRYFTCAPDTGLFILASKAAAATEDNNKTTLVPRVRRKPITRKSMIVSTVNSTASPKRNKSSTTTTTTTTTTKPSLTPSKSVRILTSKHANQPLPTRSSPSSVVKKVIPTASATTGKLKKSSSLSTATAKKDNLGGHNCSHHHHYERPLTKKLVRSSVSSKTSTELDELKRVSALLEKSQQEQKALSQQMDGKEAAWERLVSAKESYAVRVQEKDDEIMQLKKGLEQTRQAMEQMVKLNSEKEAALSRASMSEAMEKQHSKVIEKLDTRVKTLQTVHQELISTHELAMRDHAAQIDQLRKQLAERDEATAAIERECAELRQINVDTIRAYEHTITQLKQEHLVAITTKDIQIRNLQSMVNDFSTLQSPITPVIDETKKRLEAQLELSTKELDRERDVIKYMSMDIKQLKDEIKRLHRVSASSSSDFYSIRMELENEIQDKRRIMEEANAALESQAHIEEENERIRLTNDKTQRDLADVLKKLALMEKQHPNKVGEEALLQRVRELEAENDKLVDTQKQTEHECMRLMDELLAIEKVESSQLDGDERLYKREIEQLKLQVHREAKRYQDLETSKTKKIEQLHKELSDLESLVENKVFNETELEESLENEKRKNRVLEQKLREEEEKQKHHPRSMAPMSPTSPQYTSIFQMKRSSCATATSSLTLMTSSSLDTVSDHGSNLLESLYCEICEEYGHEVMTCNTFVQIDQSQHDTLPSSSYYCVNCDVFGTHPTEECPNQDETF